MNGADIVNNVGAERDGSYTADSHIIKKYWALRIIANVNRVIGAILIVVGCLGVYSALDSSASIGVAGTFSVLWSLAFGLAGTAWLAGAELIYVLIDVEANTRHTQSGTRKCPECAGFVQGAARICHFCRHDFYSLSKEQIRA